MWWRNNDNSEKRAAGKVSQPLRLAAGLCLVLMAAGASAGLLDILKSPRLEIDLGQQLNLGLGDAGLNLQLLGLVELEVDDNQVISVLSLGGGSLLSLGGGIEADLLITFGEVEDLTENNIGLSAGQLDPLDPALLSRLPAGVQLPAQGAFPVLIGIEPPAGGGELSFENTVALELHTHNLEYTPGTRLRLFGASAGEDFRDITTYVGEGSYRCRGSRGKFSRFLVALDLRDTETVIARKFDLLQSGLDDFRGQMSTSAYWALLEDIATARGAWYLGNKPAAVAKLQSALEVIDGKSGSEIPNSWRASRQGENAAGELAAAIHTLIFSLQLPQ